MTLECHSVGSRWATEGGVGRCQDDSSVDVAGEGMGDEAEESNVEEVTSHNFFSGQQ